MRPINRTSVVFVCRYVSEQNENRCFRTSKTNLLHLCLIGACIYITISYASDVKCKKHRGRKTLSRHNAYLFINYYGRVKIFWSRGVCVPFWFGFFSFNWNYSFLFLTEYPAHPKSNKYTPGVRMWNEIFYWLKINNRLTHRNKKRIDHEP